MWQQVNLANTDEHTDTQKHRQTGHSFIRIDEETTHWDARSMKKTVKIFVKTVVMILVEMLEPLGHL